MASVPTYSVGASTTHSTSQTAPPNAPVDTQYYLTGGLEEHEHKKYLGQDSFINAIQDRRKEALAGNADQYLVFCPVTQQQLEIIDQFRNTRYKGLRFLYLNHEQALVVKIILGGTHELANRTFATRISQKAMEMGLMREFPCMGSTTLTAPGGRKEGDSTFKPREFRPNEESWPTLVVECGVSQSLARLAVDSLWWLENSGGEVKIVILISVSKEAKTIHFEKWENVMVRSPRATPENPDALVSTPAKTQEIDIHGDRVTGAPLRLEFEKIMLRQRRAGEDDMIFDLQQLRDYSADLWGSTQ